MKYHRTEQNSISIFLVISIILYFSFMFCDIFYNTPLLSNCIKFIGILFCFLMLLLLKMFHPKDKDYLILLLAFAFTVTADAFLLFTNHFFYGVLSFIVVQLLYLYRIHTMDATVKGSHLLVRILVTGIAIGVMVLSRVPVDSLLVVVTFYFLNFIGNLILLGRLVIKVRQQRMVGDAGNAENVERLVKSEKSTKVQNIRNSVSVENSANSESRVQLVQFLIGMILFFLCDLCVGFYNMSYYIDFQSPIEMILEKISVLGMWGFYYPGQILIALSTKRD